MTERTILKPSPPTTFEKLLGGIPARPDMDRLAAPEQRWEIELIFRGYDFWGKQPLNPFTIERNNSTDFIVCGPNMGGFGINALLALLGPYKYGLDTEDITGDWRALFEDPELEDVLRMHEQLPNWDIFVNSREPFLTALEQFQEQQTRPEYINLLMTDVTPLRQIPKRNLFVPVMSWRLDENGDRTWIFDLTEDVQQKLAERYGKKIKDPTRLSTTLGLMLASSYPPVTAEWPDHINNRGEYDKKGREMGPAQALQMCLMGIPELMTNPLYPSFERYLLNPKTYKATLGPEAPENFFTTQPILTISDIAKAFQIPTNNVSKANIAAAYEYYGKFMH
jgi:hypothetical protein